MASPTECNFYNKCGFVDFRVNSLDSRVIRIHQGQDCGIPREKCQRLNSIIPVDLLAFTPQTYREMEVAFGKSNDHPLDRNTTAATGSGRNQDLDGFQIGLIPDIPRNAFEAARRHQILSLWLRSGCNYDSFIEAFGPHEQDNILGNELHHKNVLTF